MMSRRICRSILLGLEEDLEDSAKLLPSDEGEDDLDDILLDDEEDEEEDEVAKILGDIPEHDAIDGFEEPDELDSIDMLAEEEAFDDEEEDELF